MAPGSALTAKGALEASSRSSGPPGAGADSWKTALPEDWAGLWALGPHQDALARKQLRELKRLGGELASAVPLRDREGEFRDLVGSTDLRTEPVHRWYAYKEAFSPRLPGAVLDALETARHVPRSGLRVADFFGGVGTTAVALQTDPRVAEVRSVEYSPLAHLVGKVKTSWRQIDPQAFREAALEALHYRVRRNARPPALSAYHDNRIFDEVIVASLVSARSAIERLDVGTLEREALLVGLAAVVEPASKAIKDGRALRIAPRRRRKGLVANPPMIHQVRDPVKRLLAHQWAAMLEDITDPRTRAANANAAAMHLRGDARRLAGVTTEEGEGAFPAASVDVGIYSPPYLNFIDYTEVYKLELWLLELVKDHGGFRRLRLGTLRSHPSVRFGEKPAPRSSDAAVFDYVHRVSGWLAEHGPRPEVAPVVRQYFEDMAVVFSEQFRVLKPGGFTVCVVANSTLSLRERSNGGYEERWRLPLMSDVFLAHIAEFVGFRDVQTWRARDLRPRNVRWGSARESLVVARKPTAP
jgi:hypothetical protein